MGNPAINLTPQQPAEPAPSANGILSWVPGDIVATASQQLPPVGSVQLNERHQAVVQVPDVGRVQITYRANEYRHGRSRHRHWQAVRADRVAD